MNNQTLLHELFNGDDTISVLGHLLVTRPFDFTLDDLIKIHNDEPIKIRDILEHLIEFGLVKYRHGKYSYGEENEMSVYFEKFFKHLLLWNLERFSKK